MQRVANELDRLAAGEIDRDLTIHDVVWVLGHVADELKSKSNCSKKE